MYPKKPAEIYAHIIHFIFAVIIATSYGTAARIFINPEEPFFIDFDSLIPGFELFLAYTAIVSGWVGYTRSMIKWPHTNTKSGTFRFVLDLTILFCYFGLIASVDIEDNFKKSFLSWIVTLFILFMIWDIMKIREYKNKAKTGLSLSLWKTVVFLLIFVMLITFIQDALSKNQIVILDEQATHVATMILTIVLLLAYRYWKWAIPRQRRNANVEKS